MFTRILHFLLKPIDLFNNFLPGTLYYLLLYQISV